MPGTAAASSSAAVNGVRGGSGFGWAATTGARRGTFLGRARLTRRGPETAVAGRLAPCACAGANGATDGASNSADSKAAAVQIVRRASWVMMD